MWPSDQKKPPRDLAKAKRFGRFANTARLGCRLSTLARLNQFFLVFLNLISILKIDKNKKTIATADF
jgi:hypothetical protein